MLDYFIGFFIVFAGIGIGIFITNLVRKRLSKENLNRRYLILSLLYALIFGIGMAGGGGDVGFAFPAPIIVAFVFDIIAWTEIPRFLASVMAPFFVWWILIFLFLKLQNYISKWKSSEAR